MITEIFSTTDAERIRLVIADDHALFRSALRSALAADPGVEIVGEAASGRHAVEICRKVRPDVVLMDRQMPHMDGLTATARIRKECPQVRVVVLSAEWSPESMYDACLAGASGYLLKGTPLPRLMATLGQVLKEQREPKRPTVAEREGAPGSAHPNVNPFSAKRRMQASTTSQS